MANVQIAQASIDESGRISGGQAGDQKSLKGLKGETNISNWYKRTGGWDEIIRCNDKQVARRAAEVIIKLTNSHLIGYDQKERNTLYQALKRHNWNVDAYIASGEQTETDCAAFVYAAYCTVIPSLRRSLEEGRVSGKNNSPACQSSWTAYERYGNGLFTRYTDASMVNSNAFLEVGDLINSRAHHIIMVVSTEGTIPSSVPPTNEYEYITSNTSTSTSNISGISNNVSRLASTSRMNENILRQEDARKNEFESLVTAMASAAPKMGRDILITADMYDSNILKGFQESRKERV